MARRATRFEVAAVNQALKLFVEEFRVNEDALRLFLVILHGTPIDSTWTHWQTDRGEIISERFDG